MTRRCSSPITSICSASRCPWPNWSTLANRLTAKYRQDGYLLTQVVVPEQSIEGGKVRLQVIEGYLEHVQIKGNRRWGRGCGWRNCSHR
ncbi:POTRA domain-containing protein [Pseudomonas aeruginosa]